MRPRAQAILTASFLTFASATAARADVVPDPVETTGIAGVALAALALLLFGGVAAFRYARRTARRADRGK
jgi:hypothetical protein